MFSMRIIIHILLSCIIFVSCSKTPKSVEISLQNCRGEIFCVMPVDGEIAFFATDTIKIDSSDQIVKLEAPVSGMTHSLIFGSSIEKPIRMVLGDDFGVIINPQGSTGNHVAFTGDNAAGRDLYYRLSLDKNIYAYEWVRDFTKTPLDTSAFVMQQNLEEIAAAEIDQFKELLNKGQINNRFFKFVKADIELYYKTILSKVIAAGISQEDRKSVV